jgi:hypothetical protein
MDRYAKTKKAMNSIKFLHDQLDELIPIAYQEMVEHALAQAIEMHKQEIIAAWKDGEGHNDNDSQEEAEWYYSKKFAS